MQSLRLMGLWQILSQDTLVRIGDERVRMMRRGNIDIDNDPKGDDIDTQRER